MFKHLTAKPFLCITLCKLLLARLNNKISDKLDEEFRKVVSHKFGMRQGNLNKAVSEAIQEWTVKNKPKT